MPTLYGQHEPLDYERRQGRKGQKNVVISVRNGIVRVSTPLRARENDIEQILRQKLPWIRNVLQIQSQRALDSHSPKRQELRFIRYHGEILPIKYHAHPKTSWQISIEDNALTAHYPEHLNDRHEGLEDSTIPEEILVSASQICVQWLKEMAKEYLPHRLLLLAKQYGFRVNRITLRSQQGRWGSCSQHGNISINWRLIQAPDTVSDYVLLHELAHLREPNHQAPFWALVEHMMPEYETQKAWLREHGATLFDVDNIPISS